ncbi:TPA: tail fiber protein [Klebsiella pneumoniae]|nr:tail fiber protein [Klebsiella pneumoniae]HCB0080080.1 tail fiber protein [Klebsiella pneumoniae]HEB5772903.1 tail fiber protein [Klebsiella pneumoniae]HEB9059498.1 tail fiber protein [Klebsiella pneumoniae]HEB9065119.1 tail fiber protein [Klebsiella pneumoniae]
MSGTLTVEKEIRQTSQDSYRSVYGQYGTFWRSDDSNFYLLITQAGDPWGTSGHLRPFTLSLPTGKVTLGNNAAVNGTLDVSSRVLPGDYSNFDARYLQQSVDLPVGIPLPWASVVAPSGWLLCNGAGFDRSVFPRLAAAYPNGLLPDLRGVFLRGWDNGRGLDPGRALGDLQTGQAPASAIGRGEWGNYAGRSTGITALIGTDNDGRPTVMQETEQQRETRPVNVSFNYIVRAA